MITRMATMRSRYPNFGKPWYRHDHLRLEYGLEKNLSLTVLCENLGRNPSAIVHQLVSKGLLRRGVRETLFATAIRPVSGGCRLQSVETSSSWITLCGTAVCPMRGRK